MINYDTFSYNFTSYVIARTEKGLCYLAMGKDALNELFAMHKDLMEPQKDKILDNYKKIIVSYLEGKTKIFDIPLDLGGTEFQRSVWDKLIEIPYGEVKTYKDIAKELGKPNATRATANAIGKNPISIIVPCHRVIGTDGTLHGYHWGLKYKKEYLKLEKDNK